MCSNYLEPTFYYGQFKQGDSRSKHYIDLFSQLDDSSIATKLTIESCDPNQNSPELFIEFAHSPGNLTRVERGVMETIVVSVNFKSSYRKAK
jgi:hypothetical protein